MSEPVKLTPPSEPTLRYLEPEQVKVYRTEEGQVRVTIAGERTVLAPRFLRVSPLTDPDRYISIREGEMNGQEVGLLGKWQRLDRESRELVREELERRYLYPVVTRVVAVKTFFGMALVTLETDRGTREVTLRDVRDNVVYLGEARLLVTDAEGNRYDIPNVRELDRTSRALLSQVL